MANETKIVENLFNKVILSIDAKKLYDKDQTILYDFLYMINNCRCVWMILQGILYG